MKNIDCYCGTSFEVDIKDEINLSENPEIVDQILNNSFMEFMCPACDKILKPEYRIRFYSENMDILMVPEIDRGIIELIKLYLLEKTDTRLDIKILFIRKEKEGLVFHIYGMKEGETGVSKIPESIYNSISNNLDERLMEPGIMELLSLPYRSVNTIRTEGQ